jgi:hypothetical protein
VRPLPLHPVRFESMSSEDQDEVFDLLDGPQHLRPNIVAFHAFQIAPRPDALVLQPTLERLGEFTAVGARVRDEDPVQRRFHRFDNQAFKSRAQPVTVGRAGNVPAFRQQFWFAETLTA